MSDAEEQTWRLLCPICGEPCRGDSPAAAQQEYDRHVKEAHGRPEGTRAT